MRRIALTIVLIITVLFGFVVNGRQVRADEDPLYLELDQLYEIKDNPEKLAKVWGVNATSFEEVPNLDKKLEIIKKCPNIKSIYICIEDASIDKNFINGLSTTKTEDGISLSLQWCSVDLKGVDNPHITSLYLTQNKVKNYDGVLGLKNLSSLTVDSTMGFSQIDYSKLSNLKYLSLTAQRVDNYKDFFQSVRNIIDLSLSCCNLQNSDTGYLTEYMENVEGLNLYGTYVDDITFLKELKNLKWVCLPIGVSDLDVLYEMPYLDSVDFDAYTELFVDEKLTKFFDENNVIYPFFDRDIRKKVDKIIAGLNITEKSTDSEKVREVTACVSKIMKCEEVPAYTYEGTTLDICVNHGVGVCHNYSTIEYTLLKCVGVDAYMINGWALDAYGSPPGAHAWNEVQIDGKWYGIESMWIDVNVSDESEYQRFWEELYALMVMKPTKTDNPNVWPENGSFDYGDDRYFALSHVTMNDPMDTEFKSSPTPTKKPTPTPTKKPTPTPTKKPTATPTKKPTATPTPTKKPTATPMPATKKGWSKESGNWFYYDDNGTKVTGWKKIGSWYYFDRKGVMQTGWVEVGGKWYYMSSSGDMITGWVKSGSKWYYMNSSGAMVTGWVEVEGKWYYMGPSGAMVTGWLQSGGKWYYLGPSGAMITGWLQSGSKWYYMDTSGAMVTGWLQSGKTWYYFDANGAMVTGKVNIDGKTSSFSSSGAWTGYV